MENPFSGEKENLIASKELVIQTLKDKELSFEKKKEIFIKWLDRRQAEVEEVAKEDAGDVGLAGVMLNVEIAEIYRDSGMIEEAIGAFHDAASQALNEVRVDENGEENKEDYAIYDQLVEEARRLEGERDSDKSSEQ